MQSVLRHGCTKPQLSSPRPGERPAACRGWRPSEGPEGSCAAGSRVTLRVTLGSAPLPSRSVHAQVRARVGVHTPHRPRCTGSSPQAFTSTIPGLSPAPATSELSCFSTLSPGLNRGDELETSRGSTTSNAGDLKPYR